jgi:hypothetical protein
VAERSLKRRQQKCKVIAAEVSAKENKDFLLEYTHCVYITEGDAAQLQREIDMGKKIEKYQKIVY